MNRKMVEQMIILLRADGICLADIEAELDYRDNARNSCWDDNLYDFSTEKLEDIEVCWCET